MTDQVNNGIEYDKSSINFSSFILVMLAMAVGMLLAVVVLPLWAPNIAFSLIGTDPKAYWFLSRATGFVALGLLWLSMALGLGITNKLAQIWPGGPTAFALHEYTSLLGLAFVVFHALFLLGDHYINFSLLQLVVPFSTRAYQPFWVGLGQTGFYLGLIVTLSFYVRKQIGYKVWRSLHAVTFLSYAAALFHGLAIGTDIGAVWAQWFYWITGGSLLILFIYRVLFRSISPQTTVRPRAIPDLTPASVPVEIRNEQNK
ncbi:MAG: ferric reductase-like transmembrane domain-containing protein [Anaerolineaceae bacterium]